MLIHTILQEDRDLMDTKLQEMKQEKLSFPTLQGNFLGTFYILLFPHSPQEPGRWGHGSDGGVGMCPRHQEPCHSDKAEMSHGWSCSM